MTTTDNNGGKALNEFIDPPPPGDRNTLEDLQCIANVKIKDIKLNNQPNLLVFPHDWNVYHDDIGSSPIFSLYEDSKLKTILKTGNVMGFIGLNNTNLTITSRFASNDKKDHFLHYMLQKVLAINVFNLEHSGGKDDIWDFLLFIFPYFLNKASSQGLYKEYRRNEYNDTDMRGVMDVKRHLRTNIPFAGKIAYSAREYSYDNPVTQIIRHTIDYIKTHKMGANVLTNDTDTLLNINRIMLATSTYNKNNRQKIINQNQKRPIVHPYFTRYKTLQRLCLRILCNEKVSYNNEKERIHGILFDGAWLWEEYLNTILSENGFEHSRNKTGEGMRYLFIDSNGRKSNQIYPDFIKKTNPSIIADAKYKHLENKENRDKRNNSDYYQLITYMYRFCSRKGYLLFPHLGGKLLERKNVIKGFDDQRSTDEIVLFGMNIPKNSSDYSDFKRKMKKSEEELICEINNLLPD
jgi:5-methylcytosine-specific restriction endonuclease McrBC regulatory subunit McrC